MSKNLEMVPFESVERTTRASSSNKLVHVSNWLVLRDEKPKLNQANKLVFRDEKQTRHLIIRFWLPLYQPQPSYWISHKGVYTSSCDNMVRMFWPYLKLEYYRNKYICTVKSTMSKY